MAETKKGQLHQLLATSADKKGAFVAGCAEFEKTCKQQGRESKLVGGTRTYQKIVEDTPDMQNENVQVRTTVPEKLRDLQRAAVPHVDNLMSQEMTNASAACRARLVSQGADFGELSATALLSLESVLKRIRESLQNAATYDSNEQWDWDPAQKLFRSDKSMTYKTQKVTDFVTVAEATPQHPAQVREVSKDVAIGKWVTQHLSGEISPVQKSDMLARLDQLLADVREARAVANQAEIVDTKVGEALFGLICGDLLQR